MKELKFERDKKEGAKQAPKKESARCKAPAAPDKALSLKGYKDSLPGAADKLPAYKRFEAYLADLLKGAREAPAIYTKARNLEDSRKWQRVAAAADAKEFAQLAGKTVCLIEADIAAASPPVPPKDRGRGHKKNVTREVTFSAKTLSTMRRAYSGSFAEVAARCDKAIAAGEVPSRKMFLSELDIQLNRERIAAAAATKQVLMGKPHKSKIQLYALPIQELAAKIPPESVDLILTDPPYEKPGVPLYSELSKFAGEVLKPGGSLLAMSGSAWLPEIIRRICEDKRLSWQWALKYVMGGGETRNYNRKVFGACKIVLWLVKGKYDGFWINDKILVPPKPKGFKLHKWAQTAEGMEAILGKGFGFPGQTICDPFLGSGSTALAARSRNCDFIGSDIEPENIKITEDRLAAGWQPLATENKEDSQGGQGQGESPAFEGGGSDLSMIARYLGLAAAALEAKNQLLKQLVLIEETRMTGQVFSRFDSEKELEKREKAKAAELEKDSSKSA